MIPPEGHKADGFETQFDINHLAHFLLVQLLRDSLLSSATATLPSRVVMVSSSGHRTSEVQFDDFNFASAYVMMHGGSMDRAKLLRLGQ